MVSPVEKYYVEQVVINAFKSKMTKDENDCWVWQGSMNQGISPTVSYKNKRYAPKTCMYVTAFPDEFSDWHGKAKLTIKNSCENPRCCNPDHLYVLGSKKYNEKVKGGFVYDSPDKHYKKYVVDQQMIDYLMSRMKVDDDCLIWPNDGGKNHPMLKYSGSQYSVKLLIWVSVNEKEFIHWNPAVNELHTTGNICGNDKCCNPEHFYVIGTETHFWSLVDVGRDNDCWMWRGVQKVGRDYYVYTANGYHKSQYVHRLAYEYAKGEITDEAVAHVCNDKRCANPNHLKQASHAENIQDAHNDGLHPGIDLGMSIKIKLEILRGRLSNIGIARLFDVTSNTVYKICAGESWAKNGNDIMPDGTSFLAEYRKKYILQGSDYMTLYVLENIISGRVYIGITSKTAAIRFNEHMTKSRGGYHPSIDMVKDYYEHGEQSFDLIHIERIANCDWREAEITLIHQYRDAGYKLYNTEHI